MTIWDHAQVRPAVHQALRAYHEIETTPQNILAGLLLMQQRRRALADTPAGARHAANEVLLDALTELEPKYPIGAAVLRDRFLQGLYINEIAGARDFSVDSINRIQRKAIDQLTEIIWFREQRQRQQTAEVGAARLPPALYTRLFGAAATAEQLVAALLDPSGPPIMTVVGMGGIGKTALADYALRRCIERFHFDDVVAVQVAPPPLDASSRTPEETFEQVVGELYAALPEMPPEAARRERLTLLHHRLKTQPHLVLIDNIETAADVAYLHAQFGMWSGPSRFLLTSRVRPLTAHTAALYALSELNAEAALALLRHEAAQWGNTAMATAPDDALQPLFDVVGGNPLALKLVVGLAQVMPADAIVADLRRAISAETQDMYGHIYRKAWQALSPAAQALLESMPLVSHTGALPEQLQAQSGLSAAELWLAIQELASRSLLEVRGTFQTKRYGIHQLTRTFLHTEIIGWKQIRQQP